MNSTRVAMPQRPSDNGKTGVMYTTMSESKTCPVVCPMREACYAQQVAIRARKAHDYSLLTHGQHLTMFVDD